MSHSKINHHDVPSFQLGFILDCEQEFTRASQLESHFEVDHKDLVDTRVTWTSERLVPTALPVRRVVTPPPPLPPQRELHLWNLTAPAISLPPRHKSRSPLVPVESTSRKWRRLEVPDEEDKDGKPVIPLGDLVYPALPPKDIVLNIQRKPPGPLRGNQRLSRPQSIPHPLPHDDRVPRTVGFSMFTKKFEELAGLGDGVANGSAMPDGGM